MFRPLYSPNSQIQPLCIKTTLLSRTAQLITLSLSESEIFYCSVFREHCRVVVDTCDLYQKDEETWHDQQEDKNKDKTKTKTKKRKKKRRKKKEKGRRQRQRKRHWERLSDLMTLLFILAMFLRICFTKALLKKTVQLLLYICVPMQWNNPYGATLVFQLMLDVT